MDKDRIEGAAKPAKGAVKEAVGKMAGDAKLHAEGKVGKAEGSGRKRSVVSGTRTARPAPAEENPAGRVLTRQPGADAHSRCLASSGDAASSKIARLADAD